MKRRAVRKPLSEESSSLRERLDEAERTIQALVSGQIDADIDPTTTSVTLQHAQEALRLLNQKLEHSEAYFRSVFENMVVGFAHCRMLYEAGKPSDFVYLEVNGEFERLTGLKDVVGRRATEMIPGIRTTNAEMFEIYGRVATTGTRERLEFYVPPLDKWFDVSAYGTEPDHFVAMFDNITERKRTEEALRERLKEQTCVVAVNSDIQEGVSVDEVCRRAVRHLVTAMQFPAITVAVIELDGRRFTSGGDTAALSRGLRGEIRADGGAVGHVTVCYSQERPFLIPEEQNLINVVADLLSTQFTQKRTEERLRQSVAEYRGLVEHAPLGIYRSTPDDRLLTVNPMLVAMLGYESTEDLLRVNLREDVFVDPAARDKLKTSARQGAEAIEETHWKRKDGTRISVRLHLRPARNASGELEYFNATAEDVTAQRTLERQFQQAQKMEAVGRLAGGVAHDFNNLLTAISGYAELLLIELNADDPKRDDVCEILAATDRATGLTRQLLAFSRKQVFQTRVLDLNDVVAAVDKMLRRLIGEDINLRVVSSETPTTVSADPGQIEQVLLNLAVNARDAMPDGGHLTIETAHVELDDTYAKEQHPSVTPGQYVMLAVSDTGVGMEPEILAQIFEPFFTTKEQGKGTGLGLATVYGIVKQSGGWIWAYSEPGQGATFKVYLPRIDEAVEPSKPVQTPLAVVGGRETVLVAEDDATVLAIVARVLSAKGYRLLLAADGPTALEIARAHDGAIDLLLTDLVMPGMSGRELASTLQTERPDVRVMFMSGYTDDSVFRHRLLEPGLNYLPKPFTGEAIARRVRQALDAID